LSLILDKICIFNINWCHFSGPRSK